MIFYDLEALFSYDKLIVSKLSGWESYLGAKAEIPHAQIIGLSMEEIKSFLKYFTEKL